MGKHNFKVISCLVLMGAVSALAFANEYQSTDNLPTPAEYASYDIQENDRPLHIEHQLLDFEHTELDRAFLQVENATFSNLWWLEIDEYKYTSIYLTNTSHIPVTVMLVSPTDEWIFFDLEADTSSVSILTDVPSGIWRMHFTNADGVVSGHVSIRHSPHTPWFYIHKVSPMNNASINN